MNRSGEKISLSFQMLNLRTQKPTVQGKVNSRGRHVIYLPKWVNVVKNLYFNAIVTYHFI